MKPGTLFCDEDTVPTDCTDLCFMGSPAYTYLHTGQQSKNRKGCPFVFENRTLRVPLLMSSFGISDQSHRTYTSLFVFPKHILISRRRYHTLVPGFSFWTPEPLYKAFFVGSQLVCATRHTIYFLPGHFVTTKFVDIDHTPQALYILRGKTVEIYSDRKEVFGIDVDGALLIRSTASSHTVVLATRHDVFLVDLVRRRTRHLAHVRSHVMDVAYDRSGLGVYNEDLYEAAPDIRTSISDEKTVQSALETTDHADNPEMLYVLSPCRLTLLYMQTLRTRTVRLYREFRMKVSRNYVILTRLQTLVFLSKDLRRSCSMQADFSAFGCNGDVLAFVSDDLTIVNRRKYVFHMNSGWEYASKLFRAGGYYKLKAAYTKADYSDDVSEGSERACGVPADTDAGENSKRAYLERAARGVRRGSVVETSLHRTRKRAPKRVVCELRADLDVLERMHDDMLLKHERKTLDTCTAREYVVPVVHDKHALFSLVEEDYHSLYCAKQEAEIADSDERLAIRKYNPSEQRRRGFM